MKNNASLFVKVYGGGFSIPFAKLQELDLFTMGFHDVHDLIKFLKKTLKLDVDINDIYINYDYRVPRVNKIETLRLPIKYAGDNYDEESLKDIFADYLIKDKRRIHRLGIRYMEYGPIVQYVYYNKNISNDEIEWAANKYFDTCGYPAQRKIYFVIKGDSEFNHNKLKINKLGNFQDVGSKSLKSFESENEYFQHLIEYGSRGEEEYAKAMEIMSGYDLDEIKRNVTSENSSLVDALDNSYDKYLESITEAEDILTLEQLSGMSIEELTKLVEHYSGKKKRK